MLYTRTTQSTKIKNDLSPSGSDWIKLALDPYHDFDVPLQGLPDGNNAKTIVSTTRKSITFRKPAAISGNWDLHIAAMPLTNATTFDNANMVNIGPAGGKMSVADPFPNESIGYQVGQICGVAVPTGQNTFTDDVSAGPVSKTTDQVFSMDWGAGDTLSTGDAARVIGLGFEVTNTTSELNKQGSVTCYGRTWNEIITKLQVRDSAGTSLGVNSMSTIFSGLPQNESEAYRIANSRQWAAAEGCYVPVPLDIEKCHLQNVTSNTHFIGQYKQDNDPLSATILDTFQPNMMVIGLNPGQRVDGQLDNSSKITRTSGTHLRGAYFTGLSEETTLTITMKATIEIAPAAKSTFLTLASNPPPMDLAALSHYNEIVSRLPPGVPRSMNDAGDWFRMILTVARAIAPVVRAVAPVAAKTAVGRVAAYTTTLRPTVQAVKAAVNEHREIVSKKKADKNAGTTVRTKRRTARRS